MTALMGPQPGTGVVNVRDFLARREWRGRAREARIYMTGQILVGVAGWGGRLSAATGSPAKQNKTSKGSILGCFYEIGYFIFRRKEFVFIN